MSSDYCHFNTSHSAQHFSINLFNVDVHFIQHPGRTDLGHGVVIWDAGVIFAKYLEHQSFEASSKAYQGLTVLELGSGCGIGGLALMLCGAKVTFSDLPTIVEQIIKPNIQRIYSQLKTSGSSDGIFSFSCEKPTIVSLDWSNPPEKVKDTLVEAAKGERKAGDDLISTSDDHSSNSDEMLLLDSYDVILLTDCVFSLDLINPLVTICENYSHKKTKIICCHERRDEGINKAFLSRLAQSFSLKSINKKKLHPDYCNDFVELCFGKKK